MRDDSKPAKLFERVRKLISILSKHHRDLHIHTNVDEFYYLQKVAELKQLEESITDAYKSMYEEYLRLEMLRNKYDSEYTQLYTHWRKDVRWVNRFLNQQKQELETKS